MNNQSVEVSAHQATSTEYNTVPGSAAHPDQATQSMPSDGDLIAQISQQSEYALGALYDRYGAIVYTVALGMTQDQTVAETIVQDVFQAVWQSANNFKVGASVPVRLIGMARQRSVHATTRSSSKFS